MIPATILIAALALVTGVAAKHSMMQPTLSCDLNAANTCAQPLLTQLENCNDDSCGCAVAAKIEACYASCTGFSLPSDFCSSNGGNGGSYTPPTDNCKIDKAFDCIDKVLDEQFYGCVSSLDAKCVCKAISDVETCATTYCPSVDLTPITSLIPADFCGYPSGSPTGTNTKSAYTGTATSTPTDTSDSGSYTDSVTTSTSYVESASTYYPGVQSNSAQGNGSIYYSGAEEVVVASKGVLGAVAALVVAAVAAF
ncbi:hypothetical protein HDU76_005413 [Blyttiomyces sp. JEL0837]|nr:hypothetical protein HDU76_005413 [Blyttiomyces sp. JEL0837]